MANQDDENAAEEWAALWRPADGSQFNIKLYGRKAFLAGIAHARRWIPVEERLPEEGDEVRIYPTGSYSDIGTYENGTFYEIVGSDNERVEPRGPVTYWQPITPPPQAKEEDGSK